MLIIRRSIAIVSTSRCPVESNGLVNLVMRLIRPYCLRFIASISDSTNKIESAMIIHEFPLVGLFGD
jgi:hypothetical protein